MWQALGMIPRQFVSMTALSALCVLSACSKDEVVGHYWDVTASGVGDTCTGSPANYKESFEYRVVIDGQEADLAVGPNIFASGSMNGLMFVYDSVIWTEDRGDFEISWQIHGLAAINQGGSGAGKLENGTDWDGEEIFEVISSSDPAVSPGCTYTLALAGKYLREVK